MEMRNDENPYEHGRPDTDRNHVETKGSAGKNSRKDGKKQINRFTRNQKTRGRKRQTESAPDSEPVREAEGMAGGECVCGGYLHQR